MYVFVLFCGFFGDFFCIRVRVLVIVIVRR